MSIWKEKARWYR